MKEISRPALLVLSLGNLRFFFKGCALFMNNKSKKNLNQPFVPAYKICGLEHFIVRKERRNHSNRVRKKEKENQREGEKIRRKPCG